MVEKFATGVVDTGHKFAADVVNTGGIFASSVVDTVNWWCTLTCEYLH